MTGEHTRFTSHRGAAACALLAALAMLVFTAATASASNMLAVGPDGRIVVAGEAISEAGALARFNPDGSLDPTFGDGGVVVDHRMSKFLTLALPTDGGPIAGTSALPTLYAGSGLARYTADGVPDREFGGDGFVELGDHRIGAILTTADRRFLVGTTEDRQLGTVAGVRVYLADGSSLGTPMTLPDDHNTNGLNDLLAREDGSLIVAGSSEYHLNDPPKYTEAKSPLLAKLLPGLTDPYDASFGAGKGLVTPLLFPAEPDEGIANAVVEDGKANLIVAGIARKRPLLLRFDGNGVMDTEFGQGGIVNPVVPDSVWTGGNAAAVQPDGRILLAGTGYSSFIPKIGLTNVVCFACATPVVARFMPDGSLDTSFGGGTGFVQPTDSSGTRLESKGEDLALLPGGKILVAGQTVDDAAHPGFVVVRLGPDGSVDRSFGADGIAKALPCRGSDPELRSNGCLPAARVKLQVRGLARHRPTLHLRVRTSVDWGPISTVWLELPPELRARPGRAARAVGFTKTQSGAAAPLAPANIRPDIVKYREYGSAAYNMTFRRGFLRIAKRIPPDRRLKFRIEIGHSAGPNQTIVLRRG